MKGDTEIDTSSFINSSDVDDRIEYLEAEQLDLELEIADLKERIEEECDNLGIPCESPEDWLAQEDLLDPSLSDPDWLSLWRLKFLLEDLDDKAGEFQEWLDDYVEELNELSELRDSCQYGWEYGLYLIRDDEFTDYAKSTAEDLMSRDSLRSWPCDCIDWEQAADALRMDYSQVDFRGSTYLFKE